MTDKLILEKIVNTAKITINNPSANTWDLESLSGLEEIIELLNKDDEIFSLVITGQGEKFFSAGADFCGGFYQFKSELLGEDFGFDFPQTAGY